MRTIRIFTVVACAVFAMQASGVSAQSQAKKEMTKQGMAKQEMVKKEMMAEKKSLSRAFTNGYNVPSTGLALEGYCPVCYIEANKAAKGSSEFSYDYKGVTYWFVSEPVKKAFAANPDKYLPAYGGWCALGAALGQRFPVDPTNFKVVDGKIMLFLKNAKVDGVEIWNKNEAENLKKANANWEKLKG